MREKFATVAAAKGDISDGMRRYLADVELMDADVGRILSRKGDLLLLHGDKRYSGLDDWRKATSQETRDRKPTVGKAIEESVSIPADYRLRAPRALDKWPLSKAIPE